MQKFPKITFSLRGPNIQAITASAHAPAGFASNPGLKYRTDGIVDAPIDSQWRPPRRSEDEQHINSASSTLPLPTLPVRDHNTQTLTASARAPAGFTSKTTRCYVNNDVVDTISDSQRRPLRRSGDEQQIETADPIFSPFLLLKLRKDESYGS